MQLTEAATAGTYRPAGRLATGNAGAEGSPAGQAGLLAKLQQLKHQLSDCVNCASAGTVDGQKQIQEINTRIQQVQAQLETTKSAACAPAADSAGASVAASSVDSRGDSRIDPAGPLGLQIDIYV